jgi:hypothetical protein
MGSTSGISSSLLATGLSLLYEFRNAEGDLNAAIAVLEELRQRCGPGDKAKATLRLSDLLLKRRGIGDKQRALAIVKDLVMTKPHFPNRSKGFIRLSDLLSDVGAEVTPEQRREHLTSGINVLDEILAETELLADWEDIVIHQAKLLQERMEPGDILRALNLIETALQRKPRPTSPTKLLISLGHLLKARDQENGLDEAITRIRDAFVRFKAWPDENTSRTYLSALLVQRYGRSRQEQDLDDAIAELKIALKAPATLQNPARMTLRLCRLLMMYRGAKGLDEAIATMTQATSHTHLRRGRLLWTLYTFLKQRNGKTDAERAATVIRDAQKCRNTPVLDARIIAELERLG